MDTYQETLALNGGKAIRDNLLPINQPYFDKDDFEAVRKAMLSTFVSGDGPECRAFEEEFAEYLGAKHVFFTNSATAALDLAFMIRDFPDNAEVIVPDFTFTSTALAPILNRLKVVLVDVDPENGNIDPQKVREKITANTVAIIPVDYAGNPAEMDEIMKISNEHNLYVVHDTAQSVGATYNGTKTGNFGDISTFSFHGTKNLVCGEGGALVTNNEEHVLPIIFARDKGTDKHTYLTDPKKRGYYEYVSLGNSYVQSNILGALARSQLKKIDFMNDRRRRIADIYNQEFSGFRDIHLPKITVGAKSNWHLYYLLVPAAKRERFIEVMRAEGISANIHYHPLHLNRYYKEVCDFKEDEFPNAMKFYNSLVRLPLYPSLSDQDVEDVVCAVRKIINHI